MELIYKGWDTLPIAKYKEIARLTAKAVEEMEALSVDAPNYHEQRADIQLNLDLDIVATLYGSTREEIEALKCQEVADLCTATQWINEPMPEQSIPKVLRLGGFEYAVVVDMEKFSFGQYLDWQTLQANAFDNIPQLMACLLIPKGKSYGKGYDLGEVVRDINELMPFALAHSLFRFFAKAQRASVRGSLRSMIKAKTKEMKRATTATERGRLATEIEALRRFISLGLRLPPK